MKKYIKKARSGEVANYNVLNTISPQYNSKFSLLELPFSLNIDDKNQTLTLPFYDGENFNDKWDESNGGSPLGVDLAKEMAIILKDLSLIDIKLLQLDKVFHKNPMALFNHNKAKEHFSEIARQLYDHKMISRKDLEKIYEFLDLEQRTGKIYNNGDYYVRNLIRKPNGKIVLIDWESWNSHSPFYNLDHPENIAAVAYVHMWGNRAWQDLFEREVKYLFKIETDSFYKGLIMKSLEAANFWLNKYGEVYLTMNQIKFLKQITI